MKLKRSRSLTRGQFIRLSEGDVQQIADVANKFGLPLSEITRRSIRTGLKILEDVSLPGGDRKRVENGT
jgi:hypothetical protein